MTWTSTMGNTTNYLSLCVSQSSRKSHRERPYVSRPFWPYEHHHHLNVTSNMSANSQIRQISPLRLTPEILHDDIQSRSVYIVKIPSRN